MSAIPPNNSVHQTVVNFYDYFPSRIGAAIFVALFGVLFFFGIYATTGRRTRFMYILPFCCVLESLGYGTRYISLHNPSIGWLLVSLLSILLAPIFLAVINYNTVGFIIESTGKIWVSSSQARLSIDFSPVTLWV
jgi:hypothetical protein